MYYVINYVNKKTSDVPIPRARWFLVEKILRIRFLVQCKKLLRRQWGNRLGRE